LICRIPHTLEEEVRLTQRPRFDSVRPKRREAVFDLADSVRPTQGTMIRYCSSSIHGPRARGSPRRDPLAHTEKAEVSAYIRHLNVHRADEGSAIRLSKEGESDRCTVSHQKERIIGPGRQSMISDPAGNQ
jgi:hypothetical protein